jgi:alpha-N-arabinofuranosidase
MLGNPPPVVPEGQLQPYIQEAINEIQFITGDANTNQWAKLRAQYGHPEPYKLKYIEIGNEDFFVSLVFISCFPR